MLDLKTCDWFVSKPQRLKHAQGVELDFYTLVNEGNQEVVALSCEKDRPDIPAFVARSCMAGQKLLRQLNEGEAFAPERREADLQGIIKGTVFREATPETIDAILKEFGAQVDSQHIRSRLALLRRSIGN
jgi:hypothetical protein